MKSLMPRGIHIFSFCIVLLNLVLQVSFFKTVIIILRVISPILPHSALLLRAGLTVVSPGFIIMALMTQFQAQVKYCMGPRVICTLTSSNWEALTVNTFCTRPSPLVLLQLKPIIQSSLTYFFDFPRVLRSADVALLIDFCFLCFQNTVTIFCKLRTKMNHSKTFVPLMGFLPFNYFEEFLLVGFKFDYILGNPFYQICVTVLDSIIEHLLLY